jgi:16S rRNA (guanine527-N7)-methyltransferase
MANDRSAQPHVDLQRIVALAGAVQGPLGEDEARRLASFADLVGQWGSRTDLTSARDPHALAEVLFLDALVMMDPVLVPRAARLVDVGSGVGAPALPLALLRSDVDVTMVEPRRRRVAFLRTAIGHLGVQDRVRVVEGRVDPDRPRLPGAPFDVAASRATFAPLRWLPLGAELAPRVLVLTAASEPPDMAGFALEARRDYRAPSTGAPRAVSAYRRAPATPDGNVPPG